ncbi:hypothetical protein GCM10010909_09270 [Acidocella aquatica]|uniref:MAPEG family protein n=1 Tax=Acidocella aquatica TaxID=1922313 RepID=A0ABQ6A6T1_9PROT|nr:MAPEG family protein [Acidocella aquatica]GLR66247.1 hypothetical protein GCM10010909_09270 [Acidocella aquatica]
MQNFHITLLTAGVLGLIFLGISIHVVRQRMATKVVIGDGDARPGTEGLRAAIRMHANFAEYVPLILILLGGIEYAGAPHALVVGLAVALVAARLSHAFGLPRPAPNLLRAGGAMLTWIVLLTASITALALAL